MTHRLLAVFLVILPAAAAADQDPVGAVDRAIALWEAACRAPGDDGACTHTRATAVAKRCGPTARTVEVRRNPKRARAARAALAAALAALEKHPDAGQPDLAVAAARGQTALAEMAYEDFLRLRFPTGLDFSNKRRVESQKRFTAFFDHAKKKLDLATEAYQQISLHPGVTAELRLRALARTGQLSARLVDLLIGAEIPRDVRTGDLAADKISAYCNAMSDVTDPMQERADNAFEECRALAAGQPPWAAICARP